MWKFILALLILLNLTNRSDAAFAIYQTGKGSTQQFYNIVSDGGATCTGPTQVTRTVTITDSGSGYKNVAVTVNTFSSGDVGKTITIDGAGSDGNRYYGVISTFTDAQHIVLNSNVSTVLTSTSTTITYGVDDAGAFRTFNTWARANQTATTQTVLTIPNGAICWFASSGSYIAGTVLFNAWAAGINNLLVEGAGATITSVGGAGFSLGGQGIQQVGLVGAQGKSARLQTVNIGDSVITLTSASFSAGYISRFAVGNWIMIGGLDTQGLFLAAYGFPPNNTYFEWRQITAINTGTGAITLDRPVTQYYCSCWPEFNSGNSIFEVDQGGPATAFVLTDTWAITAEYKGTAGNNFTISQEGQTYAGAKNVTFRYVTFTGDHAAIPTQNETWSVYNSDFGYAQMEIDKLIGTMTLDSVTIAKIVQQSSSTDRIIIRNSTFSLGLEANGRLSTEITDSNLGAWRPGIGAYGSAGTASTTTCTRCVMSSIGSLGFNNNEIPPFWTKASGVITMPLAAAQGSGPGQRPFVPGAQILYNNSTTNPPSSVACCSNTGSFTVGTISADPWPATDNQSVSMNVTSTNGSKTITVSGSSFVSGDVGKTIVIPGAVNCGGGACDLRTWITAVSGTGPQDLTVYNTATRSQTAVTQTVQWGTSNMYINTNKSGGWPDVSAFTTNNAIGLVTYGAWNFTCDTCTGDANAVGMSVQAGATPGAPMGSYNSQTYTPATTGSPTNLGSIVSIGLFQSMRINVTVAATSVGAVGLTMGQFFWYLIDQSTPGIFSPYTWNSSVMSINLKQTGDRVITASGVTCNGSAGGCSGDTFSLPANLGSMWIQSNTINPWIQNGFTSSPTFTITVQTNPVQ